MVLSMTGFGRAETICEGKKISVEIRSLNGKNLDINLKVPQLFKEKEFDIRKILGDQILRGKVDCYINYETTEENSEIKINHELIRSYIEEFRKLAGDAPEYEYLKMAVKIPEAVATKPEELTEKEWTELQRTLAQALTNFISFRETEGATLQNELNKSLDNIHRNLLAITPYEAERLATLNERYQNTLKEFDNIDETRFYQEMAYYTEKLDVAEEKVRLQQHISYYKEVMSEEQLNGKKMGFIAQEMGREINTLGSKANHSEIQKLVVMMKDDLEKIKEQTLNIL